MAQKEKSAHRTYELRAHLNPKRAKKLFENVAFVHPKNPKICTGMRVVLDFDKLDDAARRSLFAHGHFL